MEGATQGVGTNTRSPACPLKAGARVPALQRGGRWSRMQPHPDLQGTVSTKPRRKFFAEKKGH